MERAGFYETRAALTERFGDKALLHIGEVCEYLGADRRTLLADESFPVRKVGNQYRVPLISLARWLNV